MSQAITVIVPNETKTALDDVARQAGISSDDVIRQALREHLFSRRFRLLRDRMMPKANAQGILTDQDVFDRVS